MPVSKSKRKNRNGNLRVRKNKWCIGAVFMTKQEIQHIRSLFENVNLYAEVTLPAGKCTYRHVCQMRDVINMCAWSLMHIKKAFEIPDEWKKENVESFNNCMEKFQSFYARGIQKGGLDDDSVRYVATGPELQAIREGIHISNTVCLTLLEEQPIKFKQLFIGLKQFLSDCGEGKDEFKNDPLANAIRRF